MLPLLTAVVVVLTLVVAGLTILFVRCYRQLKALHLRQHRWEQRLEESEGQSMILSRAVAALLGNASAAPPLSACRSQHGEELFLWAATGFKTRGFFIEVGAYDGVSLSNSLFFSELDWNGLLIEADPRLAEACGQARRAGETVHAAAGARDEGFVTFSSVRGAGGVDTLGYVTTTEAHQTRIARNGGAVEEIEVPLRSLDGLLAERGVDSVDWVSIDVEGAELDVLKGFSLAKYAPAAVMVEDNSSGTDTTVDEFLREQGYRQAHRVGCNRIYVPVHPS